MRIHGYIYNKSSMVERITQIVNQNILTCSYGEQFVSTILFSATNPRITWDVSRNITYHVLICSGCTPSSDDMQHAPYTLHTTHYRNNCIHSATHDDLRWVFKITNSEETKAYVACFAERYILYCIFLLFTLDLISHYLLIKEV